MQRKVTEITLRVVELRFSSDHTIRIYPDQQTFRWFYEPIAGFGEHYAGPLSELITILEKVRTKRASCRIPLPPKHP